MKIEHAYILYIDLPDSIKYMEQCKASCEEHGIPVTPFLGMKLPTSTAEIKDRWGFRVDPRVDDHVLPSKDIMNTWFKEQLCLTGHLAIWKEVLSKHSGAVAVFEHDAIVKRNFLDIDIDDDVWTFLGYRVDQEDDYECIDDPFTKITIGRFEGTHAYAITPKTAYRCLKALDDWDGNRGYLPLGVSIDHMMGLQNGFKLPMYVVDPAPVVAIVGNRKSHTQPDGKVATYNTIPHSGFMAGLKNREKYYVDEKNSWLKILGDK